MPRTKKAYLMTTLIFCLSTLVLMTQILVAAPIRWNVLFFMVDEHSPHFMSVDKQSPQNIFTPNLERMAKGGMVFDKAYTAYPVCAPTRASVLTGEYPQTHGHIGNSTELITAGPDGATPSIANIFRSNGYNTALLGKTHTNMQLWDASPTLLYQGKSLFLGFDYRIEEPVSSKNPLVPNHIPSDAFYSARQSLYLAKFPEVLKGQAKPSYDDPLINATNIACGCTTGFVFGANNLNHPANHNDGVFSFDALEYLDQYAQGKSGDFKISNSQAPFFLYLSVIQPHWPWTSPNMQDSIDFYAMYSGRPEDDNGTYQYKGISKKKIVPANLTAEELAYDMDGFPGYGKTYRTTVTPEAFRLSRARYSSAVSWMDHLLGKVMDKLDALDDPNNPGKKLSETTLLLYTSDHGDMMGEKYRMGKNIMQEASNRVPFLLRMPGVIPAGQHSNILINHVDMLPTLAGLTGLGAKLRTGMAGKDLSAAIKANDITLGPERTFSVVSLDSNQKIHPGNVMGRSQRYKLIRSKTLAPGGKPLMVLFDLDNDPHETHNLADDPAYGAVLNRESAAMDTFLLKFGVPAVNLKVPVATSKSILYPAGSSDMRVANDNGHISFLPGKMLAGQDRDIELSIYSQNGKRLKSITFNSYSGKGYSWDLTNEAGQEVKSSLYFYRFSYTNGLGHRITGYGKTINVQKGYEFD